MDTDSAHKVSRATIYVLGPHGYVWDAAEAHWLRLECGLVGAMVGGVAGFKQQNAVHGLPLQLGEEEITLALEKGWAVLRASPDIAGQAAAAGSRKRRWGGFHDYDSEDEAAPAALEEEDVGPANVEPPVWQEALTRGAAFAIPYLPGPGAPGDSSGDCAGGAAAGGAPGGSGELSQPAEGVAAGDAQQQHHHHQQQQQQGGVEVRWTFPSSQEERHRYWVFRDLHQSGYRITGGSKFGSEYLLYPGDPTLFHAQFCVRLVPHDRVLLPALLAAACRGSHQARKHLLLASVEEGQGVGDAMQAADGAEPAAAAAGSGAGKGAGGEGYKVHYMTIGPVEGFG